MRNLHTKQFNAATNIEEKQRARFGRRHEPGYTGEGYNYANYPTMTGAKIMGTGPVTPDTEPNETLQQRPTGQIRTAKFTSRSGETVNTDDGMGVGGTTAGMVGTG